MEGNFDPDFTPAEKKDGMRMVSLKNCTMMYTPNQDDLRKSFSVDTRRTERIAVDIAVGRHGGRYGEAMTKLIEDGTLTLGDLVIMAIQGIKAKTEEANKTAEAFARMMNGGPMSEDDFLRQLKDIFG